MPKIGNQDGVKYLFTALSNCLNCYITKSIQVSDMVSLLSVYLFVCSLHGFLFLCHRCCFNVNYATVYSKLNTNILLLS